MRQLNKIPSLVSTTTLVGILLLAFLLRTYELGSLSMWLDELFSLGRAGLDSWHDIYPELLTRNHPPLYDAFLLHNWLSLGQDEFILRYPTVLSSLVSIAVTFVLARHLFTPVVGLISALLLTLSPLSIYYGREVRMYSLVALFVVLALYFLARAVEPGASKRNRMFILYAIFAALALYTHYFAILALAGVTAFSFLWATVRRNWRLVGQLLATYVLIGLFFAPWLPTFLAQLRNDPVAWIREPTVDSILNIVISFFFDQITLGDVTYFFAVVLAAVTCFGLYLYISNRRRTGTNVRPFGLLYISVAAIGPILIAIGISMIKPLIVDRYFVPLLAPASILLGVGVAGILEHRKARLLAPVLLAGLLVSAYGVSTTLTKLDWAGVAHFLKANSEPEDSLIIDSETSQFEFTYYFHEPLQQFLGVHSFSDLPTLFTEVDAAERIWIVTVHKDSKMVRKPVTTYAEDNLRLIECKTFGEKVEFVDLCLYKHWPYERVYDLPIPDVSTSIEWDQELSLLGYDRPVIDQEANELSITVYWQAQTEIDNSYTAYFHLAEAESGALVAQADIIPRGWSYPTSWWTTGEVVEDTVRIPLQNVPPGRYELQIGWYDTDSGLRLPPSSDQGQLTSDGSALLTYIER